MLKKLIKYALLFAAILLVGYKSVYFKKLSTIQTVQKDFSAAAFAGKLWNEQVPARLDSAIELNVLIAAIETNAEDAFTRYCNAIGIGNSKYAIIKTIATVTSIGEDEIFLQAPHADTLMHLTLETEYIYGNAIRDASGLVNIKDFVNTMDLNHISEELNKKVRNEVLPSFKKQVKTGDKITVIAAIEINKEHTRLNQLELIPLRIKIIS